MKYIYIGLRKRELNVELRNTGSVNPMTTHLANALAVDKIYIHSDFENKCISKRAEGYCLQYID